MARYLVVKFGGSSFTRDQSYLSVAGYLKEKIDCGYRVCVVVSAMSGTTGALGELLESICDAPRAQDRDAVLTTGELLSSALLCAALARVGVSAKPLNAFNLGWVSDDNFAGAQLLDWSPASILDAFRTCQAVVVSGGQAVTRSGDITMLGRNSSDFTALVCAKILDVGRVRIYSDVEGVYTADPFKVEGARLIPALSYDFAEQYAQAGAKVLHPACLSFARRHSIEIECAHYCQETKRTLQGTVISHSGSGVQLIFLPNGFLLWETPDRALFERRCTDCVARNVVFHASQQESFRIAVRASDAVALPWPSPRILRADESLLLAYDETGTKQLHVASTASDDVRRIHDGLVDGKGYLAVERALSKGRSRHSRVYDPLPRGELVDG